MAFILFEDVIQQFLSLPSAEREGWMFSVNENIARNLPLYKWTHLSAEAEQELADELFQDLVFRSLNEVLEGREHADGQSPLELYRHASHYARQVLNDEAPL